MPLVVHLRVFPRQHLPICVTNQFGKIEERADRSLAPRERASKDLQEERRPASMVGAWPMRQPEPRKYWPALLAGDWGNANVLDAKDFCSLCFPDGNVAAAGNFVC